MMDLFKNLSIPYHKKCHSIPSIGWSSFVNTLRAVNIPFSLVRNPQASEQYRCLQFEKNNKNLEHCLYSAPGQRKSEALTEN